MNRKVWQAQRLIQGNFHPANTMAYIDNDHHSRLTLVFGHAHGVASLNSGIGLGSVQAVCDFSSVTLYLHLLKWDI